MIVHADDWLTIHHGDAREVLGELEAESVQVVVTSPPYFGLRDYGLPSSVWGGRTEHEHEWTTYKGPAQTGGTGRSTLGTASGGHGISEAGIERSQGRQVRAAGEAAWCECGEIGRASCRERV